MAEDTQPDALLTPAEVAALFRVNPKTVTRWARAGKITAIRTLGGHRRFRASEIRRCLEQLEQQPVAGCLLDAAPGPACAAVSAAGTGPTLHQRAGGSSRVGGGIRPGMICGCLPLALPTGFIAHTGHAGLRQDEGDDVAVIVSTRPCASAGVFTQSRFEGPSVTLSRPRATSGRARAIVVVAKNANVATGDQGLRDAEEITAAVAAAVGVARRRGADRQHRGDRPALSDGSAAGPPGRPAAGRASTPTPSTWPGP